MKLVFFFILVPIFAVCQTVRVEPYAAPTHSAIKPLTIGDTVPDVVLENIINYPTTTARLSDFKGKLLILDFWATWCTNCLYAIPKLDSLQKKFQHELQVLMVTSQPSAQVSRFFEHYKSNINVSLPSVTTDSLLGGLFPHGTIPHAVWIDMEGRVRAITSAKYVTAGNIAQVLNGESVKFPLKQELLDYDPHLPLLVNGNGGAVPFLVKTTLAGYIPGLSRRASTRIDSGYQKFTAVNQPLLQLLEFAMQMSFNNRLVLEGVQSSGLIRNTEDDDEWDQQNSYSYEIIVPAGAPVTRLREKMLSDLSEHFQLACKREKRWMDCYVISQASGSKLLPLAKGRKSIVKSSDKEAVKHFINQPLSTMLNLLNRKHPWSADFKPIILDETGLTKNLDLSVKASIFHRVDINQLKTDLARQGLVLSRAERLLDVFVIKNRNE